ncbi:PP2C family protein-serine/threonine phosphatase [Kitasatospora sp. DSM 101779]|uniref:PP2C family protein-serine/threonine phosphatase n=1 Tax=Kitasatospora sp. DSM 101779 TaxID=2853165 RepID=UPI0021DA5445|nr:PP2C family protein-serine/threonine phosphatase [Kitasatospora sp. DSM 101779]MCU7825564.1 serine/threonine-protein phosphatase [Kitasatospora sp. DSM 101779]
MIPLGFIVLISVVDLASPSDVHLGPLLVVAPAITASFAGAWLTGLIGALAAAAQVVIGIFHGGLFTANHETQIIALVLVSTLIVLYCRVRERRGRELTRVRSVSETVQRVLLRPLPDRLGPLRLAALYLPAENEALLGGDLYAATRVPGATRVLIGDVRGKGLTAIEDAAQVLGAFRELAHHHTGLPGLAAALDAGFARHLAETAGSAGAAGGAGGDAGSADAAAGEDDAVERFVTVLLADLPDDPVEPVRMANCGHPPPLLLAEGKPVRTLEAVDSAPPIGLGTLPGAHYRQDAYEVHSGETLLLYTDGVTEARDGGRAFYPLAERAADWGGTAPSALVDRLRRDLLAHVGGRLKDDAAAVAIERA